MSELGPMFVIKFPGNSRVSSSVKRSKFVISVPILWKPILMIFKLRYSSSVGSLRVTYWALFLAFLTAFSVAAVDFDFYDYASDVSSALLSVAD